MKQSKNEIYALVDEEFLSKFSGNHLRFMKEFYYKFYRKFCFHYKRKPLSEQEFFSNMHRRRIQLFQLCCPYCGAVDILIRDKKIDGVESPNYCPHCGKASTVDSLVNQISRFIRINGINRIGLKQNKADHEDIEEWLIAYDCYQMEIVELASIIEVVFRDYFEALIMINSSGEIKEYREYAKSIIEKHNGNDFMNIEKANIAFKKAFNVKIKERLDSETWDNLVDIVNLRNMMVHNNGRIDERFKKTKTFLRLKSQVEQNLFKLEDKDIAKYLESVMKAVFDITDLFLECYFSRRNAVIANYYFNHTPISNFE